MSALSLADELRTGGPATAPLGGSGPLADKGDHRVRLTEDEAQANLRAVLELCAAGRLRCSVKTSRPSSSTVGAVAAQLAEGDFYRDEPIASFAWPLLVQAGGMARINAGRVELTAKGRAALGKPAADVIRGLWQRWLTHGVIDEFSRIEEVKGQRSRNALSAVRPRRATVGRALSECLPADEWLGVDALFESMRRAGLHPSVHRNEMALWKLYLGDAQYGSFGYDGYHRWELLEGRYTLAVLFEYAATLGLVDVEYVHPHGARDDFRQTWGGDWVRALSRYDGLRAVRLTALGRYSLGLSRSYRPPAAGGGAPLKVLSSLDVVATGTPTRADMLLLSAYAERTADRVWAVSAKSLLRALDAGRDPAEFATFLTERADTGLPGTVRTLLDDMAARAARLTDLGHVRVIECADPAVAARIANDRTLRGLCRTLGERHLAVSPDAEPRFRTALLKLGYVVPGSPA